MPPRVFNPGQPYQKSEIRETSYYTSTHCFDLAEQPTLFGFGGQRSDTISFSNLSISLRRPGDPKTLEVVSVVRHDEHDLALILVGGEFQDVEALTIVKTSSLKMGDTVLSLGNPGGIGFRVVPGMVSNEPSDYIDHSCPIDPGYSGGPLILQRRGHLAGINTAISGRAVNFAFPAERLLALIEGGKNSKQDLSYVRAGFASKITENWSAMNYAGYARRDRIFRLASLARLEGDD